MTKLSISFTLSFAVSPCHQTPGNSNDATYVTSKLQLQLLSHNICVVACIMMHYNCNHCHKISVTACGRNLHQTRCHEAHQHSLLEEINGLIDTKRLVCTSSLQWWMASSGYWEIERPLVADRDGVVIYISTIDEDKEGSSKVG